MWRTGTYADNRVLALDARNELQLGDIDLEVSSLEVAGDRKGEVEVSDRLVPFIREGILLSLLLGTGSGLFGGGGL